MENAIQAYSFDASALRAINILGEPWFVAADVAAILGFKHTPHMLRTLDEDEKGVHIVDTLGGKQEGTIISESGLYNAIFRSRREEARRFRKWVTSEVLPAIRRTGRFEVENAEPSKRFALALKAVQEARLLFGRAGGRDVWHQLGLPAVKAIEERGDLGDPLLEPLRHWLAEQRQVTVSAAAEALGFALPVDDRTKRRMGQMLRRAEWLPVIIRDGDRILRVFLPASDG